MQPGPARLAARLALRVVCSRFSKTDGSGHQGEDVPGPLRTLLGGRKRRGRDSATLTVLLLEWFWRGCKCVSPAANG